MQMNSPVTMKCVHFAFRHTTKQWNFFTFVSLMKPNEN